MTTSDSASVGQHEDHHLALALLQEGEQFAANGQFQPAQALFDRAWQLCLGAASQVSDLAAWDVAVVLAHQRRFDEAAVWFGRISQPPLQRSQLWEFARQTLIEICRESAAVSRRAPSDAPARTPLPHRAAPGDALVSITSSGAHRLDSPRLTVVNLGRFAATLDGREIAVHQARKAFAVLRYLLAQTGRAAHKEELISVFWPEASQQHGSNSLHVAVRALRRHLDDTDTSCVLFHDGHYQLNPAIIIDDDCTTFIQLCHAARHALDARADEAAAQHLAAAIDCYQGDYDLDACELTWAVARREQLFTRYLWCLEHDGRLARARGQYEHAASSFCRLLEHDSYREDMYGQLIECYLRLGRRSDALKQYQRCLAVLASDLGLEPGSELQALYLRIIE